MPEAGYTKSKYQLENCRYLKVPRSIYVILYERYGMKWGEKSRDALFELAARAAVEE